MTVFQSEAVEVRVEHGAPALLELLEDLLEAVARQVQHDVAVHLDEAAVAVVGEALVLGRFGQGHDGAVVEAEVQHRVHHARHGGAGAGAHRHEQRLRFVAEDAARERPDLGQGGRDVAAQAVRISPAVVVEIGADFRRHREAGGHREAEMGHLGEVRALAAEEVALAAGALGLAAAESVNPLRHAVAPTLLHGTARSGIAGVCPRHPAQAAFAGFKARTMLRCEIFDALHRAPGGSPMEKGRAVHDAGADQACERRRWAKTIQFTPVKISSMPSSRPITKSPFAGQPTTMTRPSSPVTSARQDQRPAHAVVVLEPRHEPHRAGGEQARAEQQREDHGGLHRLGPGEDPDREIEEAAHFPVERLAPAARPEAQHDLDDPHEAHQHPDRHHRHQGGEALDGQGGEAGHQREDAQRQEPAPVGAELFGRRHAAALQREPARLLHRHGQSSLRHGSG